MDEQEWHHYLRRVAAYSPPRPQDIRRARVAALVAASGKTTEDYHRNVAFYTQINTAVRLLDAIDQAATGASTGP